MRTTKKALQFLAEVFETDVYTMSLIYPEYNWRKRGNVLPVVTNTQEHHVIQTRSIQALNSLLHAEEAIPDTLRERALAKIEDLDITVSPRTMCTTVTMSHGAKYKSKILTAQESNIVHQIGSANTTTRYGPNKLGNNSMCRTNCFSSTNKTPKNLRK